MTQAMPDELEFRSAAALPEQAAIGGELDELLQAALRTLNENERAALHLREVERMSYRRIAESLGMTETGSRRGPSPGARQDTSANTAFLDDG